MRTFGVDGEHVDPTWKPRPRWSDRRQFEI